ncbi:MAG: WYL domain-containing protein [Bacteroidales bacterium]|nr:WYL domain-containing protein [Bacteroidales bacterium]
MVSELLEKYIWLVQTFIRAGEKGLTLQEISDRWERRFDSPYSRRTFNNHRKEVEDIFGIYIDCNRSSNCYFIEYSDDVADENAESAWLINTFTVNKVLSLGKERLSGRVAVENIPSGHQFLTSVIEAMTENHVIEIEYKKYTCTSAERLTLHPYAVKENAKRWYLIAYCIERQSLRVYGLDRVKSMKITDATFRMPKDFEVEEIFATSFGIYLPDGRGQKITFRTSEKEAQYLRDLPLHSSQSEESADGDTATFSIFVCPKDRNGRLYNDLIMELCRYGSRLEVLSPADVRAAVAEELQKAADIYK